MLQDERNWLFKVSYSLDNHRRIKGDKGQMFVVMTHEDVEKLAEDIRKLAENDGTRLIHEEEKRTRARRQR